MVTHTRLWHLKQCIKALQACPEAENSELFIASDGPRNSGEKVQIKKLRKFCGTITGFKKVNLIARESNMHDRRIELGTSNGLDAKYSILRKFGAVIGLEDDVIVHKDALNYLNKSIKKYWTNPAVGSVCCFLPPGIDAGHNNVIFLRRRTPYCVAVWQHKEEKLKQFRTEAQAKSILDSNSLFLMYFRRSPHCIPDLLKIVFFGFRPGDVLMDIHFALNGIVSAFPPTSMSRSIGHDGTGINSGKLKKYQNQILTEKISKLVYPDNVIVDSDIDKKLIQHYSNFAKKLKAVCCFLTYRVSPLLLRKIITKYFLFKDKFYSLPLRK